MTDDVSWSAFFAGRREIHGRYRSVWDVPLLRKRARLILPLAEAKPDCRVLDVGGGEQEWKDRIAGVSPRSTYACVEPDPERPGDLASLEQARGPFDLALMLEVIEHMSFADGIRTLRRIHALLAPGGHLVVSTPNIFHPTRFLEDATHRTPFSHECLGGAMRLAGFSVVSLHRAWNASVVERPLRALLVPLHRALGIDYARTIFAVGKKKS